MSDFICTTNLGGGLGNQLFQAANVLAQSFKCGVTPVFTKTNNPHSNIDYTNNIYRNLNFVDKINFSKVCKEETWNLANINPVFSENIYIHGYYQSSKNFLGYDADIREIFSPDDIFINNMKNKYKEINLSNTLSIHVRRGDYFNVCDILPVISKEYINRCVNHIGTYDHMFIFSNDKDWCVKNLNYKNSTIVSDLLDYEELWLMSLCKNNIISNSTFSWWGAWLGNDKDKTVIAPSTWFGPGKYKVGIDEWYNIYEKDWVIMESYYNNGYIC